MGPSSTSWRRASPRRRPDPLDSLRTLVDELPGDLSADTSKHRGTDEFGKAVALEVLALAKKASCAVLSKSTLQIEQDQFASPPGARAG